MPAALSSQVRGGAVDLEALREGRFSELIRSRSRYPTKPNSRSTPCAGLKIRFPSGSEGSSPSSGTSYGIPVFAGIPCPHYECTQDLRARTLVTVSVTSSILLAEQDQCEVAEPSSRAPSSRGGSACRVLSTRITSFRTRLRSSSRPCGRLSRSQQRHPDGQDHERHHHDHRQNDAALRAGQQPPKSLPGPAPDGPRGRRPGPPSRTPGPAA